jgi:hypothetical protein
MVPVPPLLAAAVARARAVAAFLATRAGPIAALAEPALFPEGVPVPLTFEHLRRAEARTRDRWMDDIVSRAATAAAARTPGAFELPRPSVLSAADGREIARLAAEQKAIVDGAAAFGFMLDRCCFPDGHRRWTTVLDLLRDMGAALTEQSGYVDAEFGALTAESAGALDARWATVLTWMLDTMARNSVFVAVELAIAGGDRALMDEGLHLAVRGGTLLVEPTEELIATLIDFRFAALIWRARAAALPVDHCDGPGCSPDEAAGVVDACACACGGCRGATALAERAEREVLGAVGRAGRARAGRP